MLEARQGMLVLCQKLAISLYGSNYLHSLHLATSLFNKLTAEHKSNASYLKGQLASRGDNSRALLPILNPWLAAKMPGFYKMNCILLCKIYWTIPFRYEPFYLPKYDCFYKRVLILPFPALMLQVRSRKKKWLGWKTKRRRISAPDWVSLCGLGCWGEKFG